MVKPVNRRGLMACIVGTDWHGRHWLARPARPALPVL